MVGDERGDVGLVVDDEDAVRHDGFFDGSTAGRLLTRSGVRAAALGGAVALGAHRGVVVDHGVEDGGQQTAVRAEVAAQAVEHELGDRRVPHQLDPAEHLEVARDGGLGQVQHGLEVGDEERRRRQAVEDPEPGGLGDGEQQLGGWRARCSYARERYISPGEYAQAYTPDGAAAAIFPTPMLPLLTALLLAAAPLQDTAHVVLVATTDVHGHVTDWDYVAGSAVRRRRRARGHGGGLAARRGIPGQVVLVDAGDLLQGDPFATYFARVGAARAASHRRGDEPRGLRRGDAGQPRLRLGRAVPAAARWRTRAFPT